MSRRWLLLWPLALLLAACSSPAARARHADQVWAALETPACDLPCWQGITPGQSTLPEVESTLRSLDLVAGVECFEVPDAGETPGTRSGGFCTWESRAGYPLWGGVFQFEQPGNEVLRQNFLYLRRPGEDAALRGDFAHAVVFVRETHQPFANARDRFFSRHAV